MTMTMKCLNSRVLLGLACITAILASCEKAPYQIGQENGFLSTATHIREGVTPVTLSAGYETRTVLGKQNTILWNKGDQITLIRKGDNSLTLLNYSLISEMKVGDKKDILMVNPAKNGCFLGFNGSKVVQNADGFSSMTGGNPEAAVGNLNTLLSVADNLRIDTDFIFTLERVKDPETEEALWILYHKSSGIGLAGKKDDSNDRSACVWGENLVELDILETEPAGGKNNLVYGRPEQIRIGFQGLYLWSGGYGGEELSWNSEPSGFTNWLLYEVPNCSYPFTADSDGATSDFTNTTGFSAGSDTWFAVYPSSSNPSFTDDQITFSLPPIQEYQPGSFGATSNVSVAILDDDHLTFQSVCGVLKLSLMGTQRVMSIAVTDNDGKSLWGKASVSEPGGENIAKVTDGSATVILDCGEGVILQKDVATDFYLVVPVGAFEGGFEAEIVTSTGSLTKSTTKNNRIERADIKAMPAFSLESEADDKVVNVENAAVQAYMGFGPYQYFGETSYLRSMSVPGDAYKPQGYSVSWDDQGNKVTVTVIENDKQWYTEDGITGGSYTITNLTPGCSYKYTVDDNGIVLAEGTFNAIGQVRMVDIPDSWNCRDLGGWTGLYGKTIKYGKVFRTASLNGTFTGQSTLEDYADPNKYEFNSQKEIDRLGINAELDLRGDQTGDNVGKWGNEPSPHAPSLHFTRLEGADYQQIMTDWGIMYPRDRSSLVQDVAWIILELKKGKTVAFHCRIGSDRTGGVAYLIESLLGVAEGDLARDYELSAFAASKNGSARYADKPNQPFFLTGSSSSYNSLTTISEKGETLQEKSYFYLNQYFPDVHINAEDLDWFICEMLGLDSYEHPDFAIDYGNGNSLDYVVSIREGSGRTTYPD